MDFFMDTNNNYIKYDIEKKSADPNEKGLKRQPTCRLCQNHMANPPRTKNHKPSCPHAKCMCEKCFDIKLGRQIFEKSAKKIRREKKNGLILGKF